MENKINVAKLLKKCPEGMELDCTLFSRPLKYSGFEGFQDAYPIRTVAENGEVIWFTKEGCAHNNMYSKCVIFPKGKTTWEGFIPPCTFKPGDVLISQAGKFVLFSHIDSKNVVHYHCILTPGEKLRIEKNTSTGVGEYSDCILANEHQKQRIYDRVKSAGYEYNQDTNKLEKLIGLEFKDGDICYIKTRDLKYEHIFIFNSITKDGYIKRYANLTMHGFYTDNINVVCSKGVIEEFRYATEEEKDRLFKSIKEHGYHWNPEKKCLEKLPKFKNGDVIVGKESNGSYIAIVKEFTNSTSFTTHMFLTSFGTNIAGLNNSNPRLATEYEKQQLFRVLKEKGYKWNEEKKCLDKLPKFKDGDIVAYDNVSSPSTVFIYRNDNPDWNTSYFAGLGGLTGKFYKEPSGALDGYNPNVRFATKEEKERLFKAIKDNGYKWNTVSKTLEKLVKPKFKVGDLIKNSKRDLTGVIVSISDNGYYKISVEGGCTLENITYQDDWELAPDKFDISTLKPFDQVLVRDTVNNKWKIEFFEKFNATVPYPFYCMVNAFKQCVPYKGNEHLLDTKDECSDYYKTW